MENIDPPRLLQTIFMNWRKQTYLSYAALRGYRFPSLLSQYWREYKRGVDRETTTRALVQLFRHCRTRVPYYAKLLDQAGEMGDTDPRESLQRLPVLTKKTIRAHADKLQSSDLGRRKWSYNTSGGSTGEPIRIVQDADYEDQSKAISLLLYSLLGCEVGQPIVRLWGSERDLEGCTDPKARFFNWLTNTSLLNAFRMPPQRMRQFVEILNQVRPRLVVAYAQAAYELARFVERENLRHEPLQGIVTSAGTLYPFMREKIGQVFGCPVFNLYGSREVSCIACQIPGREGLWVPPWGNFVEILDDDGLPVEPGEDGNIVVTCLTNYAMPLVRYWIGDRGALAPGEESGQVLQRVSGRNVDVFRTRKDTLIDGEYFTHLLYFRPWVAKFQVIQKAHEHVVFKLVKATGCPSVVELQEIADKTRLVLGEGCRIDFEFLGELPPHAGGKYRYTISEVSA